MMITAGTAAWTTAMTRTAAARTLLALVALSAFALAALGLRGHASAHAAYASSEPAFGAVLERAPERISLTFSQELFRREGANAIEWAPADAGEAGDFADAGEAVITNDDRRTMSAALPRSARDGWGTGRFLVRWRNLSADDGDADAGEFPFYVGRGPTAAEEALDRELAVALLINYPGDEPAPPEREEADAATAAAVRPVRIGDDEAGGGLAASAGVWLAIGLAAGALLIAAPILRRRRAAGRY